MSLRIRGLFLVFLFYTISAFGTPPDTVDDDGFCTSPNGQITFCGGYSPRASDSGFSFPVNTGNGSSRTTPGYDIPILTVTPISTVPVYEKVSITPSIEITHIETKTGSNEELLSKCRISIGNLLGHPGGRTVFERNLTEKISKSVGPFNKTMALQLNTSLSALRNVSDAEVSKVFCAAEQLTEVIDQFNQAECTQKEACQLKNFAKGSLDVSIKELTDAANSFERHTNDFEERMDSHEFARELGSEFLTLSLDLTTSLTPGVSMARDAYEAIAGVDLIDGHELDSTARTLALVGAVTFGTAGIAKASLKTVQKIAGTINKASHNTPLIQREIRMMTAQAEKILDSALAFKPTVESSILFTTPERAAGHFAKHGGNIGKALGESSYDFTKYMVDANHTIKHGNYAVEKNAYVRLIGGIGEKAKYAFVGLDQQTGAITTFHIKYIDELIKEAPSLGLTK